MGVETITLSGEIGLIEVTGPVLSLEENAELRKAIADFSSRGGQKLLVDLSGVTFMNSTAIGVLVSSHMSYAKKRWEFKLCGVNKRVNVIFTVTKLNRVFAIYETRKEAIQSFS